MSSEEICVGDLVTWAHPIIQESNLVEMGVVIQIENCNDALEVGAETGPCQVWVLWNGKTKMAWTLPEMLKRIDNPVQN